MNYNPYFPGGAISMARVLFDGVVEYEDGTPATTSQMAKDVVEFLAWAAEPEHDERKKTGIKAVIIFSTLFALSVYVKRFKWNTIKNRKIGEQPIYHKASKLPSNLLHSLHSSGWQAPLETILPVEVATGADFNTISLVLDIMLTLGNILCSKPESSESHSVWITDLSLDHV